MVEQGAGGVPIPEIRHLDPKEIEAARARNDERAGWERKVVQAQNQGKIDLERLRATTSVHVRELESQVVALTKSLSRLQGEVDRLERENLTLQVSNGHLEQQLLRASSPGGNGLEIPKSPLHVVNPQRGASSIQCAPGEAGVPGTIGRGDAGHAG